MEPLATSLTSSGWATWNVEYRRTGAGRGWPTTFIDVAARVVSLAGVLDLYARPPTPWATRPDWCRPGVR